MVSPELLRKYRFFTGGGDEALKALAQLAEARGLTAGEVIFAERDEADRLYLLTEGQVEIVLRLGDGSERKVDDIVAGDLIGWSALTAKPQRRAEARARVASRIVGIDGKGLRDLCEKSPEMGFRLMRELVNVLARRLDGARIQLAALDSTTS